MYVSLSHATMANNDIHFFTVLFTVLIAVYSVSYFVYAYKILFACRYVFRRVT